MLHILRLGSSLCYLFNAISFEPRTPPYLDALPPLPQGKTWDNIAQLRVNMTPNRNDLQDCKKSTAHFVMAVGSELGWGRPDDVDKGNGEMFMVKMLYDQNTNATVKVRRRRATECSRFAIERSVWLFFCPRTGRLERVEAAEPPRRAWRPQAAQSGRRQRAQQRHRYSARRPREGRAGDLGERTQICSAPRSAAGQSSRSLRPALPTLS